MYHFLNTATYECVFYDIFIGFLVMNIFYFLASKRISFYWIGIHSFVIVSFKLLLVMINVLILDLGFDIVLNNLGNTIGIVFGVLILKYKRISFYVFLVIILFLIGYTLFFSNTIYMKHKVKLNEQEISNYIFLGKKDNNQTAIEALWIHYTIYEEDKEKSCYWWNKKQE
ncbi:hypothetical protein MNB_SV-13-2051 [hydrothermal vent metagenome]|uniref:Uncharacterized protein n=1 Tax=hydrothermal vent metagenome TaxID=652676 RepID=A0A1W1CYQ0_9ZZZZ